MGWGSIAFDNALGGKGFQLDGGMVTAQMGELHIGADADATVRLKVFHKESAALGRHGDIPLGIGGETVLGTDKRPLKLLYERRLGNKVHTTDVQVVWFHLTG